MDEKKRQELWAFFWFVVSVLTLLSLLSYSPDDIAFEVSAPNASAQNFVGIAGAYTAWALTLLFGRTSYFLVPIFFLWALARWSGRKNQHVWIKILSCVVFFASACALFSMVGERNTTNRFQFGGLIGYFVSIGLSSLFGKAGFFVALSLFILSILLTTELLVLQLASDVFARFNKGVLPFLAKKEERSAKAEAPRLFPLKVQAQTPKPPAPPPQIKFAAPLIFSKEKPELRPAPKPAPVKPKAKPIEEGDYELPSMDLLQSPVALDGSKQKENLEESSRILEDTLSDFGIDAKVVEVEQGPTITRYELQPAAGVKVGRITSLENDISLALRATSVRIVAPIPGKSRVGIEVPNSDISNVYLKEILAAPDFQKEASKITFVIGKDTAGTPIYANLTDMPHLLIAGATNTGKSVCINSIIMSILFRATPDEVKFIFVDPKMVELHFYNDLPHLLCPVVTDKAKVPGVLSWLISEMEKRYRVLSKVGAKNINAFNEKVEAKTVDPAAVAAAEGAIVEVEPPEPTKMPYILFVIDELADLMLASAQEVENGITRLAQLARAVGIHMILATQRPSVDIITGVIKANFPARIAFQVASKVDSRTILDENGADKLLGRGDLLFMDPRRSKVTRAQGAWVQDSEIEKVTTFIKAQRKPVYEEGIIQSGDKRPGSFADFKRDEVYEEAKRVVLEIGQASVSMVQRRLGLGYTRAARLMDMMEEDGIVGSFRGAKPRDILIDSIDKLKLSEPPAEPKPEGENG